MPMFYTQIDIRIDQFRESNGRYIVRCAVYHVCLWIIWRNRLMFFFGTACKAQAHAEIGGRVGLEWVRHSGTSKLRLFSLLHLCFHLFAPKITLSLDFRFCAKLLCAPCFWQTLYPQAFCQNLYPTSSIQFGTQVNIALQNYMQMCVCKLCDRFFAFIVLIFGFYAALDHKICTSTLSRATIELITRLNRRSRMLA